MNPLAALTAADAIVGPSAEPRRRITARTLRLSLRTARRQRALRPGVAIAPVRDVARS
jgi:hypothetical protein